MIDRERKSGDNDYDAEDREDRQGRKEGGTPNYEKGQSSPISDKEFDNSKTNWS